MSERPRPQNPQELLDVLSISLVADFVASLTIAVLISSQIDKEQFSLEFFKLAWFCSMIVLAKPISSIAARRRIHHS